MSLLPLGVVPTCNVCSFSLSSSGRCTRFKSSEIRSSTSFPSECRSSSGSILANELRSCLSRVDPEVDLRVPSSRSLRAGKADTCRTGAGKETCVQATKDESFSLTAADALPGRPPRKTHKVGPIVMRRPLVRVRKRVAVEAGVDGDGADLVDHTKLPDVDVHVGLFGELPLRPHDRQSSLLRAGRPGSHQSSRVEH